MEKRDGTKLVKLGEPENLNGDEEIINDISKSYKHLRIFAIKDMVSTSDLRNLSFS